ncbi:MAG TPA: hypothetical protein VH417_09555 [Vicinamibacterales bacterium]|jgi:hypothetical protein
MFEAAERIADAVLFEGYVLYPYRASAAKNQFRWQFGVLAPPAPRGDGEPSFSRTECLIEAAGAAARLSVRVRGLRPRRIVPAQPDRRPWLEGDPVAIDAIAEMPLDPLPIDRACFLTEAGIALRLVVRAVLLHGFVKLEIRLENHEAWREEFDLDRDDMLERSLVGAHLLLAVEGGSFVSMLEPPAAAAALIDGCQNRQTWPVLVGDRGRRTLMLSSPIVLYDYPSVASESPGDLCDAAEIDEILSLRILTMTDEEKREARATDPRARAILDRVEALTPEALAALHGTMRSADFFNPAGTLPPEQATVTIGGRAIGRGSRVRLRPNRRADAMDMFLIDQPATVAGVYRDVDERVYVAVTVDADPAASLHESFGRYFYFDPAEVEPIERQEGRL